MGIEENSKCEKKTGMNTEGQLLQMGEREECLKGVGGEKKRKKNKRQEVERE